MRSNRRNTKIPTWVLRSRTSDAIRLLKLKNKPNKHPVEFLVIQNDSYDIKAIKFKWNGALIKRSATLIKQNGWFRFLNETVNAGSNTFRMFAQPNISIGRLKTSNITGDD